MEGNKETQKLSTFSTWMQLENDEFLRLKKNIDLCRFKASIHQNLLNYRKECLYIQGGGLKEKMNTKFFDFLFFIWVVYLSLKFYS